MARPAASFVLRVSHGPGCGGPRGERHEFKERERKVSRLVPILTIGGGAPRSTQRTHTRSALVGLAALIALLAVVLFAASPVTAQNSPTVQVSFSEDAYTVAESDDPTTPNVAEN